MPRKIAELLSRNRATVEALPTMNASEKFALLESLELERKESQSVGEAQTIMDLYRVIEQDLWGWAMHAAFEERAEIGGRRKTLAGYMQPNTPLADQLREIAGDLALIVPADRFTLLSLLNERVHGRAKPGERLMFLDVHQLTKQSLWTWMTQKAMEERAAGLKKRKVAKKSPKTPAKKAAKKVIKKVAAKKVVKTTFVKKTVVKKR